MTIPGPRPARVCSVATDLVTAERTASALASATGNLTVRSAGDVSAVTDHAETDRIDCLVVTVDATGTPLERYTCLDAVDEAPVVAVYPSDAESVVDEAVELGATDCVPRRVVEDHPDLFARRVSTAVAAARSTRSRADSADRYRRLFDQVPDPVGIIKDGVFVYANDPSVDLLEADRDRILGSDVMEIIPEEDRDGVRERFASLLEEGQAQVPRVERELVVFDGQRKHVQVTSGAITYEGEQAILITARDVTERKEREQRLTWYETMVETVGDVVYTLDENYYFTTVTGSAADLTGYTCEELERKHLSVLLTEADVERGQKRREKVIRGEIETGSIEVELQRKDGGVRDVEFRYRRLPSDDFRGTAGVVRDISARKRQERELRRQNERLEEFASIVSHDLRNPLNVARGHLDLAGQECDSDHLEAVAGAHARMETLIDETLALAKQGQMVSTTEPIPVADILADCWAMVATEGASLQHPEAGTVHGDPERVRQLFENLFRNAVEHASTSSRTGSDDAVEHGGDTVSVRVGILDGGFFVADDGPGIPREKREQVFESGHTTAEDGTGFGLAIVAEIVDAHGWDIRVTESETGGARFEVTGVDVDV